MPRVDWKTSFHLEQSLTHGSEGRCLTCEFQISGSSLYTSSWWQSPMDRHLCHISYLFSLSLLSMSQFWLFSLLCWTHSITPRPAAIVFFLKLKYEHTSLLKICLWIPAAYNIQYKPLSLVYKALQNRLSFPTGHFPTLHTFAL